LQYGDELLNGAGHTGDPTLDLEYERHRQAIPEPVQRYLQYFQKAIHDQNSYEIENYYENG